MRHLAGIALAALATTFAVAEDAQTPRILTNHLGYDVLGAKHAVIEATGPDSVLSCSVQDLTSGKEALALVPQRVGAVAKWKDWRFWVVDFDGVTAEGSYVIACETSRGAVRSFPFVVQKNLLERNTLSNVVYYLKGQRSSGALDKADSHLPFEGGRRGTKDLRGGWFDATGDYGKHLSHLSFSTYFNPQQIPLAAFCLARSYRYLVERREPNLEQYERRLLDEALWGADYLVRARDPRGSFYRSVSAPGPGKKPEDRRIGADARAYAIKKAAGDAGAQEPGAFTAGVASYEVGYRSGGGMAIAALALASTLGDSGAFASRDYLAAAEGAFAFLEAHNLAMANDAKENILDDYCALEAATSLYGATRKPAYKAAADRRARSLAARLTTRGSFEDYWRADDGERPFFHAADAGLPVVSLLHYADIAEGADRTLALDAVRRAMTFEMGVTAEVRNPFGYARQLVVGKSRGRRTSFFFPHDTEAAPWWQGENARLASLATAARLAARRFEADRGFAERLRSYAQHQLDWILGLNPFDASMLQGTGRNNPPYMFFDSWQYTNAPGGISNGVTAGFEDEDDIDLSVPLATTGADNDWRWGEQWLPHASWFLLAVAVGDPPHPPAPLASWRALHLLDYNTDVELDALGARVPSLAAAGINVLILEVDYNFAFVKHPELRRGRSPITPEGARRFAEQCQRSGVRLIPEFQSLGHQSWEKETFPLLATHPDFDLTPGAFPANQGLYCREWDPLNPEVTRIALELMDEIVDAFGADAIHVGMDEVFLLGSDRSPSTKGQDPAVLFARAVNDLHAHLVGQRHLTMLMWSDRLFDGRGLDFGEWESSLNGTAPALDRIPKDIVLCPWHYEKRAAYPSIATFLAKGFRVLPASWKDVLATNALIDYGRARSDPRLLGHMVTTWTRRDDPLEHQALAEALVRLRASP
jgi:Glycosyl hydrolase family 9/Cellulase N-terminal ig-like domain/Glycosyl hydrolase family 20, catalytic domain